MAQENEGTGGKKPALDLGAVWARGVNLLKDNAQLIAILAGVFVLLPYAALQFTLPPDAEMEGPMNALLDPGASDAIREKAAVTLSEMLSTFMILTGPYILVAHVGYAGIVALIGGARPTVGQALSQAARVVLPLFLAIIIAFVALYVVLTVVQLVLTPLGPAIAAFLGAIVGFLAMFYLTARLYLTLPVMVIEWELNPLKALLRSWKLTSINTGNVFGFWMLMAVAWFVTAVMHLAVAILLTSIPGPGPTATLMEGLLMGGFAMVWGSIYSAMGTSMYLTLRGPEPEEIAAEFE